MKKSYMNKNNILNEGFFEKIKKLFGRSASEKLASSKQFQSHLTNLNISVKNIEKSFEDLYGKKIKLNKFTLSDFI